MWAPGKIPAGLVLSRNDVAHGRVADDRRDGRASHRRPKARWKDNNGKPIYFDGIDNRPTSRAKPNIRRATGWIYIDGENFSGVRADIGGDPEAPDLKIAWKMLYTSKDTWMGPDAEHRCRPIDSTI